MSDFAKASLVGLISHQLQKTNPEVLKGTATSVDAVRNARVPAKKKRDFLDLIWRKTGAHTLLSIGQGIRDIGYDPVWHEAVRAESPDVVFEKWRRFEKFGHSRNRLRITYNGKDQATFERYAVRGDMPTTPENLLICGLVIALLEINGCKGLYCDMPLTDGTIHRIRNNAQFLIPSNADLLDTTGWSIKWHGISDGNSGKSVPVTEQQLPAINLPSTCKQTLKNWVLSVVGLMMQDVSRQWKIDRLAALAGVSKRSFQRRLHDAGLSFSHLVRLVRVHEACRLLRQPDISITTIGYCAGFSDSAHFSRDFRASVGMAPSQYRNTMVADLTPSDRQ